MTTTIKDMASTPWKEHFNLGISLYKEEKYEEAVEVFTKVSHQAITPFPFAESRRQAISVNGDEKQLFDSRASALEKLGRYKVALKDAKRVVDLAPSSWQVRSRCCFKGTVADPSNEGLFAFCSSISCSRKAYCRA